MKQTISSDLNLSQILENHRGERHLIVLHDFPDPDAIASAFAHQLISKAFDIEADILYTGEISHQQNRALVKLIDVELLEYEDSMDLEPYQAAIFIDNQGATVEKIVLALEGANIPTLLVVDHHKLFDRLTPEFSDILETGATSTIYAHYLEKKLIELDKNNKDHVLMATALLHGILTDTGNFVRANVQDFHAAAFLSQCRDADMLSQIMSQERSKHVMDAIHSALENREIIENFSIAGVGYVRASDRDLIPQAADFLLTEENAHTAIVYGIVKDDDRGEKLIGSLRTAKFTLDADKFIKDTFGKNMDGGYFGGGRQLAGGFAIPVDFLSGGSGEDYQALKWKTYDKQIRYKILKKIGVEPENKSSSL